MTFFRRILFVVILTLPLTTMSQSFSVKKDLTAEKLKFENDEYIQARPDEALQTSYFLIDADEKDYLEIKAARNFTLFVNGKMAASERSHGWFSVDSLKTQFSSPQLRIGVFCTVATKNVQVKIYSSTPQSQSQGVMPKPRSSFRDFSVIAILTLLGLFISLLQLNPKLTSEYFALSKVFLIRETDDGQIYTRVTSSSNILFYIFSSLLAGFSLMLIFEFTSSAEGGNLSSGSFWNSAYQWIRISFLVLTFFFVKIVLVYSLSRLFGIKGAGRIHFFYWIRVLLITTSFLALILFLYFISRGQNTAVYETILWIIMAVLTSITVLVFLKLMRRSECSIFHLFSYICATEIIPFLITIKLLHQ